MPTGALCPLARYAHQRVMPTKGALCPLTRYAHWRVMPTKGALCPPSNFTRKRLAEVRRSLTKRRKLRCLPFPGERLAEVRRFLTKHRQLRCLPFPEEAVSLSLSRPWCSYIRRAFGPATYARPGSTFPEEERITASQRANCYEEAGR